MRPIGFSTGAVAKADFRRALTILIEEDVPAIELSALRYEELPNLVMAASGLPLGSFRYVSFHGPSKFDPDQEQDVISLLECLPPHPIVMHPDVLRTPEAWTSLGPRLLIENMDHRKPIGQTAEQLTGTFQQFPEARLCFDIGHARQIDPTMREAHRLLQTHGHRLTQVHLSLVNPSGAHLPLSQEAIKDFRTVLTLIPSDIPIILETPVDQGQSTIPTELHQALSCFAT